MEAVAGPKKWTRDELTELKQYYKDKINGITAGGRGKILAPKSDNGVAVLDLFKDISD